MSFQFITGLTISVYLLLPGYILLVAARVKQNRFLLAYGISISILVFSLFPFLWLSGSIFSWLVFLHMTILSLTIGTVWYHNKRSVPDRVRPPLSKHSTKKLAICCLFLIFVYSIYHILVGPYTEIPSDFWKHLARVVIELDILSDGYIPDKSLGIYLTTGSSLIYILQALVANLFVHHPLDLVPTVTLVTSSIFLASVFWFSVTIYFKYFEKTQWVLITACLATLLTLLSFGTATFSYARYYSYFPTIFCFPLVYACIVIFIDFLQQPLNRGRQLLLIPCLLLVMIFVHHQEALLTIIILGGIAFIRTVRSYSSSLKFSDTLILITRARMSCYLFLGLLTIVIVVTFSTRELTSWQNTPHVLDAGRLISALKGLPIDNPSFRLWDTLGYFGLIVYGWAILNWKLVRNSDYLIAGLLIPIFTNLNPIYATIFLHYASPTGLWRTAYLIPLPMVAALLICTSLSSYIGVSRVWKRYFDVIVIALLFISIVPWSLHGYYNRTSKIPSLMPVHTYSGAELWIDLIQAIQKIETTQNVRRIFTDEVTKFVLYAANKGEIWLWPRHEYFPKNQKHYKEDFTQSDLTESLIVVNRRNGAITASAKHAGHWSKDILNVARHYPSDLDNFLSKHPDYLKLIWESDGISIYQMATFDE